MNLREQINARVVQAIKEVAETKNIKKSEIARSADIRQSTLSDVLGGRLYAGTELIAVICSDYGISPEWILFGKGEMFRTNNEASPLVNVTNVADALLEASRLLADASKRINGKTLA